MTRRSLVLAAALLAVPTVAAQGVSTQPGPENAFLAAAVTRSSPAVAPMAMARATARQTFEVLQALARHDRQPLFHAAPTRRRALARADWGRMLDRLEEQGAVTDVHVLSVEARPEGRHQATARVTFGEATETVRMVWNADGDLVLFTRGAADDCPR